MRTMEEGQGAVGVCKRPKCTGCETVIVRLWLHALNPVCPAARPSELRNAYSLRIYLDPVRFWGSEETLPLYGVQDGLAA